MTGETVHAEAADGRRDAERDDVGQSSLRVAGRRTAFTTASEQVQMPVNQAWDGRQAADVSDDQVRPALQAVKLGLHGEDLPSRHQEVAPSRGFRDVHLGAFQQHRAWQSQAGWRPAHEARPRCDNRLLPRAAEMTAAVARTLRLIVVSLARERR